MANEGLVNTLKLVSDVFAAVGGVVTPFGFTNFLNIAPPFLQDFGITPAAITGFLLFIVLVVYKPSEDTYTGISRVGKWAIGIGCAFIVTLLLYILLLNLSTVYDPQKGETRYQIGFGNAEWSMTDKGKEMKQNFPNETIIGWMERNAAFSDRGPEKLWKSWSISLAGILLAVLYIFLFVFWAWAWALLGKQLSMKQVA
jgi:energy-coupling factor transporter transmembrane protein EcfT